MSELTQKHCVPCEGGTPALEADQARELLAHLDDWTLNENATEISRTFKLKNFHETMEFVNALAWIAHREDHHPNLEVGYNRCRVRYSTHAIGGLSENDFICAAKVDALLK
ncbi:MAG: 4a-hydroxytetrahydrobiopterin dehydratase [Gammaproteobacteria bacterium]|nr:4a-hydroxytetrahydrobiopterin dehydratase [Gammaproteobacteria bacterium]NIR84417.1 4a-hydroxytetrahydrobiopterin dehydratase [Gammaproteobacteria bacterium]NIR90898.1 4a-hydroxytetrahydrobiopterin dehydratase [Gammaproteobacteria bacterium]NIU07084.1 4a-hydroxytetrahydrobiopterin dehydratase [Gammaproteobacteria bacterium]NIV76213.1 4a-hydroxytetrahydrobiopterin dehydratase [Gammaproteobacteria bacterium]